MGGREGRVRADVTEPDRRPAAAGPAAPAGPWRRGRAAGASDQRGPPPRTSTSPRMTSSVDHGATDRPQPRRRRAGPHGAEADRRDRWRAAAAAPRPAASSGPLARTTPRWRPRCRATCSGARRLAAAPARPRRAGACRARRPARPPPSSPAPAPRRTPPSADDAGRARPPRRAARCSGRRARAAARRDEHEQRERLRGPHDHRHGQPAARPCRRGSPRRPRAGWTAARGARTRQAG